MKAFLANPGDQWKSYRKITLTIFIDYIFIMIYLLKIHINDTKPWMAMDGPNNFRDLPFKTW